MAKTAVFVRILEANYWFYAAQKPCYVLAFRPFI